jgi:hypothetical protein
MEESGEEAGWRRFWCLVAGAMQRLRGGSERCVSGGRQLPTHPSIASRELAG